MRSDNSMMKPEQLANQTNMSAWLQTDINLFFPLVQWASQPEMFRNGDGKTANIDRWGAGGRGGVNDVQQAANFYSQQRQDYT